MALLSDVLSPGTARAAAQPNAITSIAKKCWALIPTAKAIVKPAFLGRKQASRAF